MSLFRVNVRQIEVSHVVVQVEVEAEDEAHAIVYAFYGIGKELTYDKEYVSTRIRRLNYDTYTVMEAEPLRLMEKAQKNKWLIDNNSQFTSWKGEAHNISLPNVKKVETD